MRVFRGGSIEERILPQRDHFQLQMDHISNVIMNGGEILTPGEEGLKDMKAIAAVYEAATSGKTVSLSC
jgi:glucose-fructose oxidoreductase